MDTFGDRLRKLRENRGLSQTQLGRLAGITQPSISALEAGTAEPRASNVERLAKGLGVRVTELYGEEVDPEIALWFSFPPDLRKRLAAAAKDPEHQANLERWLDGFEQLSPERQKALLLAVLREGDEG